MAIPVLDPPLLTDTKSIFASKAQVMAEALPGFATEANAVAAAMNLNDTISSSTTSMLIGNGSKTFTVDTGKSYVVGMHVTFAYTTDATEWMAGVITAYDSGTGSITVNMLATSGHTTTRALWTVSQALTILDAIGDQEIILDSANGHGSTGTMRRKYTTVTKNTGSDMTLDNNATTGMLVTVNTAGDYAISAMERYSTTAGAFGIVDGSYTAGGSILSATTQAKAMAHIDSGSTVASCSVVLTLAVSDTIAVNDSAALDGSSQCRFSMKRIR